MIYDSIYTIKKWALKLILGLSLFGTINSFAQINAFVGYVYSQNKDTKILNDIFGRYNTQNTSLLSPMSMLNNLHGVDLGMRYRFPAVSIEFNWVNKFSQLHDRALTTDNVEYKNIIYYKSQTFCLGTEFFHEWFGIGASIDWNKLVLRKEKSTDRIKDEWLAQGGFSNHFFLNFEFNMNDAMAISIRPYIQMPLYKNDFYVVETKLNPDTANAFDPESYKQKVTNWGIKFLFMNGAKSR